MMALNPRITDWRSQHVWLVGASTGIGRATAERLHSLGARVTVSARGAAALDAFAAAHPGAQVLPLDATDADAVQAAAQRLLAEHGRIDLALYCAGHYRPMRATAFDLADALRHQQINYVGALNLLDAVLPALLRQAAAGTPAHLGLVASVAGYRGLPNALAYGPTKAALINLAEVLYLDLHSRGAGVSLINPGFVETPLTAQNSFHMPALITPEAAAEAIVAGWEKGEFEIHFPKRFTRLLKAMRQLPDRLYFGAVRRAVRA
jgi:NAD(P)-dependent dehydrogenase (short-subunit alcohol dehydrogenase family)